MSATISSTIKSAAKAPNESSPRNARIISVASGKGGVGKTWCSIGLANGLAEKGKRTLLFDGDLGLANVDIQLGLMPEYDINNILNGDVTMMQARLPYLDGGFDIIAGRSGSGSLANLPASRLAWLREQLNDISQHYERVIIDLGAGVDRTVRTLASQAGISVVVITPDPSSLTDSYAYIKLLSTKPPLPDIRIIVNMAENKDIGEKAYKTLLKACQSFLKISPPLLGIVRRDKKVVEAIRAQTSLLSHAPNSEAAGDIRSIAALLM